MYWAEILSFKTSKTLTLSSLVTMSKHFYTMRQYSHLYNRVDSKLT